MCAMPLYCLVPIFSFAANQLAQFPTSNALAAWCSLGQALPPTQKSLSQAKHGALPCQLIQHYIDNLVTIVFECYNPFDYYEL